LALGSFIERGGERMQVIVRAPSPGQAIALAQRYREWLFEQQLWSTEPRALEVLQASPSPRYAPT
jgi:hypothetical protein